MQLQTILRPCILAVACASFAVSGASAVARAAPTQPDDDAWIRVVEGDSSIALESVARAYAPADGRGPIVHLVGAVHIGDWSYYDSVQALLDAVPVVLWEGVGGGFATVEDPAFVGDQTQRVITQRRVRFLDAVARLQGATPGTLNDIVELVPDGLEGVAQIAKTDAWGRPLIVDADDDSWAVVSLGADGEPGGEGDDADVSSAEHASPPEAVSGAGLQADLASALGLTFQMDGVDYQRVHWRNSDLSLIELRRGMNGEPVAARPNAGRPLQPEPGPTGPRVRWEADEPATDGTGTESRETDALMQTLSGEGAMAGAMKFIVRFMGRTPSSRASAKVMLSELLLHADDLLAVQPGPIGSMLDVIIHGRNDRVLYDIDQIIAHEPEVEQIAVFYGGGHLPGLAEGLVERGYEPAGELWIPAITVDLTAEGIDANRVRQSRQMIETFMRMSLPPGPNE